MANSVISLEEEGVHLGMISPQLWPLNNDWGNYPVGIFRAFQAPPGLPSPLF